MVLYVAQNVRELRALRDFVLGTKLLHGDLKHRNKKTASRKGNIVKEDEVLEITLKESN